MVEMLKLWEVLKDGKSGDKFEIIAGDTRIVGKTIELIEHEDGGLTIVDDESKNAVVMSNIVTSARFTKPRIKTSFIDAWKKYREGYTIASYVDNEDFELNSPYATYGNDSFHDSIEIEEMEDHIWEVKY